MVGWQSGNGDDNRNAADFIHAHADQYDRETETCLRERATEFATVIG